MVDLDVLCDEVVEDHVAGHDVLVPVHGACVTQAEGPVVKGTFNWFPKTR
jgi:hypothetical protein